MRRAARRVIYGELDLPAIVARKGRMSRWVGFNVLRLQKPPSLVSRQNHVSRWISANVRHELPMLYHFDIHLTDHCNLNCKGCVHFSCLCKPWFIDPEQFSAQMKAMAEKVKVEQIFLLGGEPLLHPQIADLVRRARIPFPDTRICVVTNGLLVMKMDEEFWRAMAETGTVLICGGYPVSLPKIDIEKRASEYGVRLEWTAESGRFYKVPIDFTGSQDPKDSFLRCGGITNCPLYKDGRLYPCAYPPYVRAFTERFGIDELAESRADSISIADSTSEEIAEFMRHPIPFCRYCDFDHFEEYKWDRTDRSIDEWTVATGEKHG